MTKTMTNVIAISMAIETLSAIEGFNEEALGKLENIKASYEKKASATRKPSKKDLEKAQKDDEMRNTLHTAFKNGFVGTMTELIAEVGLDISPSKATALCKPLKDSGFIVGEKVKGKMTYHLVEV